MKTKIVLIGCGLVIASLFGIAITLWLSQQPQDIRQQASELNNLYPSDTEKNPPAIEFPKDHGAHNNFLSEWWYLNLLVKANSSDGNVLDKDFGYILAFSRILGVNRLLTSRYEKTSQEFDEKTDFGGSLKVSLKNNQTLNLEYSSKNTNLMLIENPPDKTNKVSYHLFGSTASIGKFDLLLKERTVAKTGKNTPLLWGCTGKISVFSKLDTFYYSIPDLDVSGTITDINKKNYKVSVGKAWIDHQWFNSKPPSDWLGHYWLSTHVTFGNDIYDKTPHQAYGLLTQIYKDQPKYSYWVKRNSDGSNACGNDVTYKIDSYDKSSGFPAAFKLEAKNSGISQLNGTLISNKQIFNSSGIPFVEAVSYIQGKNEQGKIFTGLGFFETAMSKNIFIK